MNTPQKTIGIVGVGFMGSSIAADLLVNGQAVIALSPVPGSERQSAPQRVEHHLQQCYAQGITRQEASTYQPNITYSQDYRDLKDCDLVIESVVEQSDIKQAVFEKISAVVKDDTIITTNTSAIPINELQRYVVRPERFFGMHWAEPAFTSRFLEIVCGDQSSMELGEALHRMASAWGKEPTLVRKDIRGFITNRLMYALYREAFYLVENGYATKEDVDRACKTDGGTWMAFCGPFRYMDLTGFQAYYHVMKDLFPTLDTRQDIPEWIEELGQSGANGISTGKGFYEYTEQEAKDWEQAFEKFSFAIHRLTAQHAAPGKDLDSPTP